MAVYEDYPKIKGKTLLKIFWLLHDLVLFPPILLTIGRWTDVWLEPPQLILRLMFPFVACMILEEMAFLTYIISAVLLVCTIICIKREKHTGHPVCAEIAVFSVFLILCVMGLLSSREFLIGAMSV